MSIRDFVRTVVIVTSISLSAATAHADAVSWVGLGDHNGTIIGNALSSTRTSFNESIDRIDIHLTGFITAAFGQGNQELQILEGTWTVTDGGYFYLGGNETTWKSLITNDEYQGQTPPQSYVNFNATVPNWETGWVQSGLYNSSLAAPWFANPLYSTPRRLTPIDTVADGFDATLLASLYVTKGKDVMFTSNPEWGGWGFTNCVTIPLSQTLPLSSMSLETMSLGDVHDYLVQTSSSGSIYGSFCTGMTQPIPTVTVPEPSIMLLLCVGALGLAVHAWRRFRLG